MRAVGLRHVGHVLDDAHHLLVRLGGDEARSLSHLGGSRLRGGDHEDLGVRQQLCHRDGHVSGPGRQVQQEDVQVAPEDVGEELLDGAVQHGAAPDDRLLVLDEHADRDDLHPVGHGRHDHAVELGGDPVHAQHAGDGEAVDVGVDDAHAQALGGHGSGQVRGHRGLTDPALAGGHGVDPGEVARLGEGNHRFSGPSAQPAAQLGLLLVVHDAQTHLHPGDALDGADLALGIGGDRVLQRAPGHGQEHLDTDHAVLGDVNGGDHTQVGDGTAQLGVDDPVQRLHDGVMSR